MKNKEETKMIITDFNELSITELEDINTNLHLLFQINDGMIVGTEKENIPANC